MFYRLLGVGAKIADLPFLVLILLFVWILPFFWAGKLLHEDDRKYDQTTVSSIANGWQPPPDHHVLITGSLLADLALQTKRDKEHAPNGETYVPLLDADGKNVLLVEYSQRSMAPKYKTTRTVAGALVGLQGDLSDVMPADGSLLYNHKQYLLSDESLHIQRHIGDPTLVERVLSSLCCLLTFLLVSLPALALLAALKRKVIFRPQQVTATASSCSNFAVRISARLSLPLDETSSALTMLIARAIRPNQRPFDNQYFSEVPGMADIQEDGTLEVSSLIDASRFFNFVRIADRAGRWRITIAAGTLVRPEGGVLCYGFRQIPAVRFRGYDSNLKRAQRVVLTFSEAEQRNAFLSELQRLSELKVAATVPEF